MKNSHIKAHNILYCDINVNILVTGDNTFTYQASSAVLGKNVKPFFFVSGMF